MQFLDKSISFGNDKPHLISLSEAGTVSILSKLLKKKFTRHIQKAGKNLKKIGVISLPVWKYPSK